MQTNLARIIKQIYYCVCVSFRIDSDDGILQLNLNRLQMMPNIFAFLIGNLHLIVSFIIKFNNWHMLCPFRKSPISRLIILLIYLIDNFLPLVFRNFNALTCRVYQCYRWFLTIFQVYTHEIEFVYWKCPFFATPVRETVKALFALYYFTIEHVTKCYFGNRCSGQGIRLKKANNW